MAAVIGGYRQLKKYGITWDKIRVKAAVLLLLVLPHTPPTLCICSPLKSRKLFIVADCLNPPACHYNCELFFSHVVTSDR